MPTYFSVLKRLVLGVFLITLALLSGPVRTVPAQTDEKPAWTPAVNLSGSGYSISPTMVQDSFGIIYGVWKDQYKGVVYSRLVEGEWSTPVAISTPWSTGFSPDLKNLDTEVFTPHFVADHAGRIHAFWIDGTDRLLMSTIEPNQFVNASWAFPTLISEAVLGFEAAVDNDNQVHVSYISVLDSAAAPAGVYYRRSNTVGGSWNTPTLIYESEYFRGLEPVDVDVQTIVVDNEQGKFVFTSFDNRPRKQFYLARSGDGGSTWDAPVLVTGPESSLDANIPSGVGLTSMNDQLLVLWRKAELETPSNCVQYYQVYGLDGSPLDSVQTMFNELGGCPLGEQKIVTVDNRVVLLADLFSETYLIAWNGDRWSLPQAQPQLSNFIDPGTFDNIELDCLNLVLGGPDQFYLIGCDAGSGSDIWFTTRPATDVDEWFSTSDEWSAPIPLASAGGVIDPITLVSDGSGILHAIWAQTQSQFDQNKTIYYARWDGSAWTYILSIIQPAFAKVNTLAAAVDPEANRLYLVWSGGERGELYFTWANATLAGSAGEWSDPIVLPMPSPIGGGADIFVDKAGTVYVAYSVPVNESRGAYFVRSYDNGSTWDTPTRILDGAALDWEVVGAPALMKTADGKLHAVVTRLPPPEGDVSKRLYYFSSIDAGANWSAPIEVVVGDVNLGSIGPLFGQQIYRYWQESFDDVVTNYIQTSVDSGVTWSETMNFIGLDSLYPTSSISVDAAGNLHLVQAADVIEDKLQLQEWLWNGSSWSTQKSLDLGSGILTGNSALVAAIRSDVYLGVLISKASQDPDQIGSQLIFVERKLNIVIPETPPETPVPTPEPTMTSEPTPTVTPLAGFETPVPELAGDEPVSGSGNLVLQLVVGFSAAVLVVLVASVLINRFIQRGI